MIFNNFDDVQDYIISINLHREDEFFEWLYNNAEMYYNEDGYLRSQKTVEEYYHDFTESARHLIDDLFDDDCKPKPVFLGLPESFKLEFMEDFTW